MISPTIGNELNKINDQKSNLQINKEPLSLAVVKKSILYRIKEALGKSKLLISIIHIF
jgi:hypothetical protein